MNCKHCKAEWTAPPDKSLTTYPFCHEPLTDIAQVGNNARPDIILQQVVEQNGLDLPGDQRLGATLSDFMPPVNRKIKKPKVILTACDWSLNSKSINKKNFMETTNNLNIEMILVEGGTFTMGATPEQEPDSEDDEYPAHEVSLDSFYIGKYPVTQQQWKAIMGENPSHFESETRPVEQVSWYDIQKYLIKLNKRTGKNYRLPTEAEWEYAARGGQNSRGYKYSGSDNIYDVCWFEDNSGDETQPVGTKKPNELGIHDMSGNVWEWCQDWFDDDYYKNSPGFNPQGPSNSSGRSGRGGGWNFSANGCRVSSRYPSTPDYTDNFIGFRLVLVP